MSLDVPIMFLQQHAAASTWSGVVGTGEHEQLSQVTSGQTAQQPTAAGPEGSQLAGYLVHCFHDVA